jgi:hypothetical protein
VEVEAGVIGAVRGAEGETGVVVAVHGVGVKVKVGAVGGGGCSQIIDLCNTGGRTAWWHGLTACLCNTDG